MNINEKISKGQEFNIQDDDIFFWDMIKAEEICHEYNNIPASEIERRKEYLKKFFGKVNGDFLIFSPLKCGVGYNIEIGNYVVMNSNCSLLDGAKIKFGNNIWVGPNCGFYTSGHSIDPQKRLEGYGYAHPIIVEDNVWIGANVLIVCSENRGITIGENSVLAAGSVITKDVPANVLVGGNPSRVIKRI
ncbi:MAG: sugar O-acetyltransferase [Peptostreptococcus sp.]|uniref:sugar O-acetyltransferase n=1 Tax=Peptostreptococcus sp. TaxID=1262 RepID=UPI000763EDD2|nr:sugar O-acetyltransferase [Peptostreptococcus sp.]KWZ94690.1 putative maltose O-acetyltransferase [Anaerococcus hydrogenalis]MDU6063813.1 sugar O-acetyltransferase [Anaerococcus sp.]HEO7045734.1 sugar O-acetyltransferase [Streptococcus agalactiae]MDU5350753.1 sugar O-acetyltransferase [Peptostreptococcus sp.]MDU5890373.1 sugar O-acetyltransferase [Peptostreptococcus sp.]